MHHIHFLLKILKGRAKQIFWPDFGAVAERGSLLEKNSNCCFKSLPKMQSMYLQNSQFLELRISKVNMKFHNPTIIKFTVQIFTQGAINVYTKLTIPRITNQQGQHENSQSDNYQIHNSNNHQRSMLYMGKCCLYHFKSNLRYDDTTNRPLKQQNKSTNIKLTPPTYCWYFSSIYGFAQSFSSNVRANPHPIRFLRFL